MPVLGLALGRLVLSMVDEARGVLAGTETELAGEVGTGAGTTVDDSTGEGVSTGELWAGVVSAGVL